MSDEPRTSRGYNVTPCPYALDNTLYETCPRDVHGYQQGERCADCPAPDARLAEVESRFLRTLSLAAAALERCEVADDPSGAADEAAALLRQCVALDGSYVPAEEEPAPCGNRSPLNYDHTRWATCSLSRDHDGPHRQDDLEWADNFMPSRVRGDV